MYPECWENLANAIIERAAEDYLASAIRAMNPKVDIKLRSKASGMKRSCKAFFKNIWFSDLTNVDPNYLIAGLDLRAKMIYASNKKETRGKKKKEEVSQ